MRAFMQISTGDCSWHFRSRSFARASCAEHSLQRETAESRGRAIAPTCGPRERISMKTKRILSVIGLTLLALSPTTWAAGHGGGGGGFGGGGGRGGGGGHFGGGGRGGGVGFGLPAGRFGGGVPRFSGRGPRFSGRIGMSRTRQHVFSGQSRGINRPASSIARNRGMMPSAARPSRTFPQRGLNGRTDHIAERHDANWHRDWDRRHAHFFHNRFFVFDDGFWFGLDPGFYPWDYLPYYADDYYPYDYYADSQPYDNTDYYNNGVPAADPTVEATQEELAQQGYYNGPVDGIFGPTTRDAVAKYQIANQLNVTGSLSTDTLQSLGLPEPAAS